MRYEDDEQPGFGVGVSYGISGQQEYLNFQQCVSKDLQELFSQSSSSAQEKYSVQEELKLLRAELANSKKELAEIKALFRQVLPLIKAPVEEKPQLLVWNSSPYRGVLLKNATKLPPIKVLQRAILCGLVREGVHWHIRHATEQSVTLSYEVYRELGISQKTLAKEAGVSVEEVDCWEGLKNWKDKNHTEIREKIRMALAKMLGVAKSDLKPLQDLTDYSTRTVIIDCAYPWL